MKKRRRFKPFRYAIKMDLDGKGGGQIWVNGRDISQAVSKAEVVADADKQETKIILTLIPLADIKVELDSLKNLQFVENLKEEEDD